MMYRFCTKVFGAKYFSRDFKIFFCLNPHSTISSVEKL